MLYADWPSSCDIVTFCGLLVIGCVFLIVLVIASGRYWVSLIMGLSPPIMGMHVQKI